MMDVKKAVQKIADLKQTVVVQEATLERHQQQCQHDWGQPIYSPIIRESYTIPADPPGTMGVDWRGACYVPREEKARWTRECRKCLLSEATSQTTEHVTKTPRF